MRLLVDVDTMRGGMVWFVFVVKEVPCGVGVDGIGSAGSGV